MADESFNKAGEERKKKTDEKKKPMQISWMMRLVLETKSRLTWIDTEHKIILGWIRCAWLYIQRCIFSLSFYLSFPILLTWKCFSTSHILWIFLAVLVLCPSHRCFGGLSTTDTSSAAPRMGPEQSAATYSVITFHSTQHMNKFRTIPLRWCLTS